MELWKVGSNLFSVIHDINDQTAHFYTFFSRAAYAKSKSSASDDDMKRICNDWQKKKKKIDKTCK